MGRAGDGDRSGTNRTVFNGIGGVIVATVLVVVLMFVIAVLVLNFYDVTHTTPLARATPGRCFKQVYPEDVMVQKDCTEKHGSELVAIVQHPAPAGAAYAKANFELNIQALDLCRDPVADYVGQPERESPTLTYAVDYPSEDEWRRGDRAVRCFAIAKDGAPALTRSVRDGARPAPA
jgi:hypothetical protein